MTTELRRPGPVTAFIAGSPRRISFAVACLFGLPMISWLDLYQHYDTPGFAPFLLAAMSILPLFALPYRPLLGWGAELAACVVISLVAAPVSASEPWPWPVTSILIYAIVLFIVGQRVGSLVQIVGMWLVTAATQVTLLLWLPDRARFGYTMTAAVIFALVLAASWVVRTRGEVKLRLAQQQQVSATEREKRQLLGERARIARELHDVVAHHMSLITVQAQSAPYRLANVPEPAAREFSDIAASARLALTELRQVLVVLRDEDGGAAEHGPQPRLADLSRVVEGAGRAGIRVTASIPDEFPAMPPSLELTGYRVVQEALSNVIRHAPGASVDVVLDCRDSTLTIRVANTAAEAAGVEPPGSAERSGLGLIGMRERVALHSGVMTAGREPDGGFVVDVELPLAPREAA
ncbi:MAG TPA: sensor histidine kinase [Mycobacteriales bacterium]|jgi:signal transduction histidine kinase|nr:sensor histidine kinase [Mycobacteriales bacterium]